MKLVQIMVKVYEAETPGELPPWRDENLGEGNVIIPTLSDYTAIVDAVVGMAEEDYKNKMNELLGEENE